MNRSAALRRDSLGVANLLLVKVLRAPLWLLLSAALARLLEPAGLGTWSMILAAAMFLNQLLVHWTQSITQRFGRGEWLARQSLDDTFATRWPLLGGGFAIVLLVLALTPLDWPRRFYGLDDGLHWYILPAMLSLWLVAETQSLQQVRERYDALAWPPLFSDLLLLLAIGALLLIDLTGNGVGRHTTFACLYATPLLAWLGWLWSELRGFRRHWRWPCRQEIVRAAAFAAPLLPGFLISYLAEWGDYFLIRHFFGEEQVGLFHPAYQYLLIMVGLPTALASVLLPKIVAAHDQDGGAALHRLVARHAPQFTLAWGVAALLVAAVLPWVFGWLLGARYTASVAVLQVLLVAAPGAIVQHVYGVACFAQGRLGVSTLGFFGAKSALNLTVSFLLLPALGISGSAIGSALSYLLLQWLFVLDQHRQLALPAGNGVRALLLVQAAGIVLALLAHPAARLLVASVLALLLLAWARRTELFSRDEVLAVIPARLQWLAGPLQRLLCRTS